MAVCKKCGSENPNEFKFCGFCGSNLEGKVQCKGCDAWIDEAFLFCPHCGKKVKDDTPVTKITHQNYENDENYEYQETNINPIRAQKKAPNLSNVLPKLTNILNLCISLIVAFILFGTISRYKINGLYSTDYGIRAGLTFDCNLIDYFEASINGLKEYTSEDFMDDYLYQPIVVGQNNIFDINFLNYFMVDDVGFAPQTSKAIIFVSTLVLIAMFVMPLILCGFSIYDLVKDQVKGKYRIFSIINLILCFSFIILTKMINFNIGFMIYLYAVLSFVPLIYDLIIKIIAHKVEFSFAKLVTPLAIILIFILGNGSVAKYQNSQMRLKESIHYGTFSSIVDGIYNQDADYTDLYQSNFVSLFIGDKMRDANVWILYFSIIIPVLMAVSLGFLIAGLVSELRHQLKLTEDNPSSCTFLWVSTMFTFLTLGAVIVVSIVCNYFYKEFRYDNCKFNISANIIIMLILLFGLTIYRTIIRKKYNN